MDSPYLLPALCLSFLLYRFLKFKLVTGKIKMLNDAIIVDVRSPAEFAGGANPLSINIPLDSLEKALSRLDKSKPIVLCCASGGRSGMAASILKKHGFPDVVNAGPWQNTVCK